MKQFKILFKDQNGVIKMLLASNCEDQIQAINKVLEMRSVKKLIRVEEIIKPVELEFKTDGSKETA